MRLVLLAFLISFLSLGSIAQETRIFHGGLYGGFATSQVSGDQLSGFKKIGPYGGAFINVNLSPSSLLQFEISYIQKGSRSVSKIYGLVYNLNLQYIELPVLYKYQFKGRFRRFNLEAGLATGFLMKTTDVERNAYGLLTPRPAFNLLDLSAMGGLGIKILDNDKFDLITDIRASQSLIRIRKHESGAVYRLNRGQYNSVLALVIMAEF